MLQCTVFSGTELLVYMTKIIQGLLACVRVRSCVLCVGGRTLSVSDQDYPRAIGRGDAMFSVLGSEPIVYQTKIIQGLVAGVRV